MKKIFFYLLIILNFSCTDNDDNLTEPFVPVTIIPTLVGKGNINGSEGVLEQKTLINNSTDWNILKNQIDYQYIAIGLGNYYTDNNFEETTIDFDNYTVIAIFDQVYPYRGHSIDIISIIEYETNIIVTVDNLLTGNTQSATSQPYHIVKIPNTTKPIVFE